LNAELPPSPGFTLASFFLRADRDLVSLIRRTRQAGEEFGLGDSAVRSLSAATYELARGLVAVPEAAVELRLGDGPSLQVVFRIPLPGAAEREQLAARLSRQLVALRGLVHDIALEDQQGGVTVSVRMPFPAGPAQRLQALASPGAVQRSGTDLAAMPPDELRARYLELDHAFQELQLELQETNRGVVALYAELEANAEHLRQAEDRLRLLLDGVQDYAICMLTPRGEIGSWNAGAERLFGYAADEIVGRSFACFYQPAERDVDLPREHLRQAAEEGRFAAEGCCVRHGGSAFEAHIVLTAVRAGRDLRGFSLVVRDITERKRLESDLRRRAEELAAANRAKEEFLATLSHELRTPLNAMLGWTRLLRTGRLDEASMARALRIIERNAQIQEQLIADILDVSRIVTGKLRLEVRPIELVPVANAAMDAVRPAAQAKGVRLESVLDLEAAVLGDPDRLQQVVWNLLVNAIKFTPPGGAVTLRLAAAGPYAAITVTDTGEGIAPTLLPFIFDRFMQGDASATRPHGGLGLGLAIVRHIVELHGGRVHAASDGPDRGATFSVFLPLRAVRHLPAQLPAATGQPLTGVRVLVVDDDPDAREVVSRALAQCGARTAAVSSADEALQLLPEFRPDVLVSDIAMPGEDGYALIRRVRAIGAEGIGDVPAVALTAYSHPEDRRRALVAGFQSFVPKPVEVDELAAVVRTLAERRTV
jgi:PAS domain S-box-containing protein